MKSLYETKISDARWYAYDLPGNVGWIAYLVALILCFAKTPDFMRSPGMRGLVIAAILPAALMLVGIAELIHERIKKQDRILPRWQLLLGFGALTLGGVLGVFIALAGLLCGKLTAAPDLTLICVMLFGAALCAIFAGLLYKGYKKRRL